MQTITLLAIHFMRLTHQTMTLAVRWNTPVGGGRTVHASSPRERCANVLEPSGVASLLGARRKAIHIERFVLERDFSMLLSIKAQLRKIINQVYCIIIICILVEFVIDAALIYVSAKYGVTPTGDSSVLYHKQSGEDKIGQFL